MPEFGYPGLPVLSDEERLRRNKIQQEWSYRPSMDELRKASEAETYRLLNEDPTYNEPTTEQLLNEAKDTLAEANVVKGRTYGRVEHAIADAPAAREQARQEFRAGPVGGTIHTLTDNPVVTGATIAGSLVPHPLAQGASRALLGLQSAAGILDPETDPLEKAMWGLGGLQAAGAGKALSKFFAPDEALTGQVLPPRRYNPPAGPRLLTSGDDVIEGEVVRRSAGELPAGRPPIVTEPPADPSFARGVPATYPKATMLEPPPVDDVAEQVGRGMELPGRLQFNRPTPPNLEIQGNVTTPGPFGPGSPSTPSGRVFNPLDVLRDVADEGVDLTSALDDIAEAGMSADDVARARAAERFGQNFANEGGAPARESFDALQREVIPVERLSALEALASEFPTGVAKKTGKPVQGIRLTDEGSQMFGGVGWGKGSSGQFVPADKRGPVRLKTRGRKK